MFRTARQFLLLSILLSFLCLSLLLSRDDKLLAMASLPYRDINYSVSSNHYSFSSPSATGSQTLVVDRPSGDIRLHDGPLSGGRRISSIAGILGMIKLRLGEHIGLSLLSKNCSEF